MDLSSFTVTGDVYYKNSSCGVADAPILIDGVPLIVNGTIAKTDPTGAFSIQVPIGNHFIEVQQEGHVYATKRFPSTGTFNFQEAKSGIHFIDSTLLKVVGRVVGGLREATKIPGLGKSKTILECPNSFLHLHWAMDVVRIPYIPIQVQGSMSCCCLL